jgi:hypothetical protein
MNERDVSDAGDSKKVDIPSWVAIGVGFSSG